MGTNLGDLLSRAGFVASREAEGAPAGAAPAGAEAAPPEVGFAPKVVVRASRKGHGGKTVTTIQGVRGAAAILGKLRRELGVGGRVEGEDLLLQGDQVERVARWLESQGAPRVVRSR